jgi:hypothetical protein
MHIYGILSATNFRYYRVTSGRHSSEQAAVVRRFVDGARMGVDGNKGLGYVLMVLDEL